MVRAEVSSRLFRAVGVYAGGNVHGEFERAGVFVRRRDKFCRAGAQFAPESDAEKGVDKDIRVRDSSRSYIPRGTSPCGTPEASTTKTFLPPMSQRRLAATNPSPPLLPFPQRITTVLRSICFDFPAMIPAHADPAASMSEAEVSP